MTQDTTQKLKPESFVTEMEQRDRWLEDQIRQLSVDVLDQATFTCTACGEVAGEYIISRGENIMRLSAADTYAFLQFIASTT